MTILWSLDLIDAKVIDREHWARGTGIVTIELSSDAQKLFGIKEKNLQIFYGQGPLLGRRESDDPLVPDYECLALYRTEIAKKGAHAEGVMPGTSAIVRTQFEKGRVIFVLARAMSGMYTPRKDRRTGLSGGKGCKMGGWPSLSKGEPNE